MFMEKNDWLPTICVAMIIFFGCSGIVPIPYIISLEIFPKKIRQVCIAIAVSIIWTVQFLVTTLFPFGQTSFGLPFCFAIFGVVSLLNAVFAVVFLFETRNRSYEEIMSHLISPN